jgi:Zn-dependent protease with chaperone function
MARRTLLALLVLALGLAGLADAAKPGDTLAVYQPAGTALRSAPKTLSSAVATLASGTRVFVREANTDWLKVMTLDDSRKEGWLRKTEVVPPEALAPNPRIPAHLRDASDKVSQHDVSVAGRQFNAEVERQYRSAHPNLATAYALVDRLIQETQAMPPAETIAFILEGRLGRPEQDYLRPPMAPPTPAAAQHASGRPARPPRGIGGLLGHIPGGDKIPGKVRDIAEAGVETLPAVFQQIRDHFTPEQEYYLGRAVAAQAIAKYGVEPDPTLRAYVRRVGDAVVRLTTRLPSTAAGYFFEVLDTDEINGLSGPGGFVMVTRGAVRMCRDEEELAAILCHELGHVKRKDGETTLRQGKVFQAKLSAVTQIGAAAAGMKDRDITNRLVDLFTNAVGEMARISVENDYGQAAEFGADLEGVYLLMDVVYDHRGMNRALGSLARHTGAYHQAATHAPPAARAQNLYPIIQRYPTYPRGEDVIALRKARFLSETGQAAPSPTPPR